MSIFKKLIFSLVLSCFLLTSFSVPYAHAQYWYLQEYKDWYARVYPDPANNPDEIFGERYTAAQVEWVIYGLFAFIFNHVLTDQSVISCILTNRSNPSACSSKIVAAIGEIVYQDKPQNEALADNNAIKQVFFGRELSTVGYIKRAASKFKLAPEVKAQDQGFGFDAASSVRQLWVGVRNLTYFFLVLAIIAMSFMIMFRVKISPQTVITIQTAIPKIIITLILITFSYAIAGFLIDLMYVVIGLIAALLDQSNLFNNNWSELFSSLTGTGPSNGIIPIMFIYFLAFAVVSFLTLVSTAGAILDFIGGTEIIAILIIVIAFIVLLFLLIRIMWMVLRTFIILLLYIAIGPILILGGLVGGSGFGGWIKNLAAYLAVFPAIGFMLAMSFFFLANSLPDWWPTSQAPIPFGPSVNSIESSTWVPPFVVTGTGGNLDIAWLFASLVILTLIPRITDIIRGLLTGRPFAAGTAIGEAWAPAGAAIGMGWGATGIPQTWAYSRDLMQKDRARQLLGWLGGKLEGNRLTGGVGTQMKRASEKL